MELRGTAAPWEGDQAVAHSESVLFARSRFYYESHLFAHGQNFCETRLVICVGVTDVNTFQLSQLMPDICGLGFVSPEVTCKLSPGAFTRVQEHIAIARNLQE